MTGPLVVREDDPRVRGLLDDGWVVAHRSWAARLREPAVEDLAQHVVLAVALGYRIAEAGTEHDPAIAALEEEVRPDYPGGPATAPSPHDAAALAALRSGGTRFFAAFADDALAGVTAVRAAGQRAETDFTSVAHRHRRKGLAVAVKAASILALAADGVTLFGTGGAARNAASLAMNARLGYVVTERWLTLAPRER